MEQEFWQKRWQNKEIAFHEAKPNALLTTHFPKLGVRPGNRIFVPLCGKSADVAWLASRECKVTGIELNRTAVEELFAEAGLEPEVISLDNHILFRSGEISVFIGDFFSLTSEMIGPVDSVYDRAALVAMPPGMRQDYAHHLVAITGSAPQLLVTYDYDQAQTNGPPFSVPQSVVCDLYSSTHSCEHLESIAISGPLARRCQGIEVAMFLSTLPNQQ